MSKELKQGINLVHQAMETMVSIEELLETHTAEELAESHIELLNIAKELEAQVETLFTYAKSLEMENKSLQTRIKLQKKVDKP